MNKQKNVIPVKFDLKRYISKLTKTDLKDGMYLLMANSATSELLLLNSDITGSLPDNTPYGIEWSESLKAATQGALYDKIETIVSDTFQIKYSSGDTSSFFQNKITVDGDILLISSPTPDPTYGQQILIRHNDGSGYNHIPSGGSTGQVLGWISDGVGGWVDASGGGGVSIGYTYVAVGTGSGVDGTANLTYNGSRLNINGDLSLNNVGVLRVINTSNLWINNITPPISTGTFNTVIGYDSAQSLTGGGYNVVIGYRALKSNSNGSNNVAIGKDSLYNGNGSYNVSIGSLSMSAGTTGNYNTAIGYYALNQNTANGGTAVGNRALQNNTSGTQNTAIGYSALGSNVIGTDNTAVGNLALYVSLGSRNTAIGLSSYAKITSGNENVAVGGYAGYYVGTVVSTYYLTTANRCVHIGYRTRSLENNATNEVVIGYDTAGNGSNTVTIGNNSITNTFLKGCVNLSALSSAPATGAIGKLFVYGTNLYFDNGTNHVLIA